MSSKQIQKICNFYFLKGFFYLDESNKWNIKKKHTNELSPASSSTCILQEAETLSFKGINESNVIEMLRLGKYWD